MNYSLIKKAMAAAGHVVTEGEHWAAADAAAFRDFSHFTLGIAHDAAHGILQFPAHFEAAWKKIAALGGHHEAATPVPAATPVATPVEVPATTTEPVAETATVVEPTVAEPVVEPVAETAPAEQAPETPPIAETSTMTMDVSGTHSEA